MTECPDMPIVSVSWDLVCLLISDFLGQVVRRIYKGIPASVRGLVWARILSINKTREEQTGVYMVNRGNDSVILLCFIMKKYLIWSVSIRPTISKYNDTGRDFEFICIARFEKGEITKLTKNNELSCFPCQYDNKFHQFCNVNQSHKMFVAVCI